MTVYVNGRFLAQPTSGVQRFAREVLRALDRELCRSAALRDLLGPIEVLAPRRVEAPGWQRLRLRYLPGGYGHLWEQGPLWRASRDGVLISLGNSGPLGHRAQVMCLHDTNLWDIPEAYSARYRLWHRALRPRLARRAAALLTVSRHSAKALAERLSVSEARFRILHNSADHMLRLPSAPDAPARYGLTTGNYLLSVGNLSPNKNLRALINAHAACGDEVPPLVLVGGAVPGIASQAAAGDRVIALGRVPDCDLRGLYEGASAFVFAALHEGFGIPPLEAMRLGVPVICARRGAMPEILGDAPLWFDPCDGGDIVRALRALSQTGALRRHEMVWRGRRRADLYDWHRSAMALAQLVVDVWEAHCGPRKDTVNGFASRDLQTVNFNIAAEGT
ncbi:MAG: glycosyltransferase family 4 protein [Roseovarius sp.]